ncbi:E3 ubiquitin-protein ligase Hakai [Porites harrisoni]
MEDDLELEREGAALGSTSQPVRRNISLKLKAKSKSASSLSSGKSKKKEGKSGEKSRTGSEGDKESKRKQKSPGTAAAAQVVVMRELKWDHQILPIGQKVQDPLLHLCEKCSLPILVYGRLSPCKHSFCLTCTEKGNGKCPR